jgi:hypothetical protein
VSEATIIITSDDLAEHAVLSRKRTETSFRRDFLIRNGAAPTDAHVTALDTILKEINEKLNPIEEKLQHVDLITIVPGRGEIANITAEINHNTRTDLDAALKSKSGPVYELMKKRAALTKANFERREDVAKLTLISNMLPKASGEGLRSVVENNSEEEVDVSSLPAEKQQELVNLMGRLARLAFIYEGKLCLDKKKVDGLTYLSWEGEVLKTMQSGQPVWINKDKASEWDSNESIIHDVGNKIIAKTHEKQVRQFSDDELANFDKLQRAYIDAKEKRNAILPPFIPVKVELPRIEHRHERKDLPTIDL